MKTTASDVEVLVPRIERRVQLDMSKPEAEALMRAIGRALPLVQKAGNPLDVARLQALSNALTSMAMATNPTTGVFEVES